MRSRKAFGVYPRTGTSLLIAMVFMTMNMCSFAQEPNADTAQLMREVIRNELQSQNEDQSHWRYRQVREADGTKELRDVYQTTSGDMYRVLAINDGLLNPKQAAAERRRLQSLLSDPNRMRERQEEQQADGEKARKILNMLPSAFRYRYEGMEGHLIRLEFTPNQEFHPTNRAGEVFHHLTGKVLIDGQSKRLAEIRGRGGGRVPLLLSNLGPEYRQTTVSPTRRNSAVAPEATARSYESLQRIYPGADAPSGLVVAHHIRENLGRPYPT